MPSLYPLLRQRWTQPDRTAITFDGADISYAALDARVRRALGWLRAQGLGRGDTVALQLGRDPLFLELHLAALAGGMVTLPLNPDYTPREVQHYLDDARPRLALLHPDPVALRAALDATPAAEVLDDAGLEAPAVLCYTSGTTGRPKGAVISQGNILGTVAGLHTAWQWSAQDTLLHVLPLFHIHGLFVAQYGALYAGARSLWMARFDPARALEHMQHDGVTVFMGVPTLYSRLLALPPQPVELSGMRLFTSGSAPLPARVHAAFEARFGHRILERYGMTEVGIVLSNPIDPAARRPGAVGLPLPGVEVRICDPDGTPLPDGAVGELRIRGPGVIREYLGLPEQTAAVLVDGWMRSGDLGYRDEEGYIRLAGRAKDLIISGGLNVYPAEVEGVLLEHPAVAQAAVLGLPDPDWGERVVAAVVLQGVADGEALLAHCAARLAGYKRPRQVFVVPDLPRNALGKVQKEPLRAALLAPESTWTDENS